MNRSPYHLTGVSIPTTNNSNHDRRRRRDNSERNSNNVTSSSSSTAGMLRINSASSMPQHMQVQEQQQQHHRSSNNNGNYHHHHNPMIIRSNMGMYSTKYSTSRSMSILSGSADDEYDHQRNIRTTNGGGGTARTKYPSNNSNVQRSNSKNKILSHLHPLQQQRLQQQEEEAAARRIEMQQQQQQFNNDNNSTTSSKKRNRTKSTSKGGANTGGSSDIEQPQSLFNSIIYNLQYQFYRLISILSNGKVQPSIPPNFFSDLVRNNKFIFMVVIPIILILLSDKYLVSQANGGKPGGPSKTIISKSFKMINKLFTKEWDRMKDRELNGRHCVMNLFIDKQKNDEWHPDFVDKDPKTGKVPKKDVSVKGTYRSKGQMKLINRYITSVADSFRSNIKLKQHVLFVGTRDGGHLAKESMINWPQRGKYKTQLHIISESDDATFSSNGNGDGSDGTSNSISPFKDGLEYNYLSKIEETFDTSLEKNFHVHLYDSYGNIAGAEPESDEEEEEDDDAFSFMIKNGNKNKKQDNANVVIRGPKLHGINTTIDDLRTELPDIKELLFSNIDEDDEDNEDEENNTGGDDDDEFNDTTNTTKEELFNTVIPYMHVDGTALANQMYLLKKTTSLLVDKKIVAIGIEHSPDMDLQVLIDFFKEYEYKTFMLGLRQLTRIDNVCSEMLDNVMDHPFLERRGAKKKSMIHKITSRMTTLKTSITSLFKFTDDDDDEKKDDFKVVADHERRTPPFFVAMPRGRHQKEEMTIQHMYDLFSGAGGGGQVKTANDRKAPGKK